MKYFFIIIITLLTVCSCTGNGTGTTVSEQDSVASDSDQQLMLSDTTVVVNVDTLGTDSAFIRRIESAIASAKKAARLANEASETYEQSVGHALSSASINKEGLDKATEANSILVEGAKAFSETFENDSVKAQ